MPPRTFRSALIAVTVFLCGLAALPASAQSQTDPAFKIIPYAAFFFEGNFDDGRFGFDDFFDDLSLDEGEGLGLAIDFRMTSSLYLELSYSEQETTLEIDDFFGPSLDVDLDVQYLHASVLWQWSGGQVQPFVLGGIGLTRLSPAAIDLDLDDDETRFSAAVGGGVELVLGQHIGLRLHARVIGTFIDSDDEVFCNRFGCYSYDDNETLSQVETGAGLVLRF